MSKVKELTATALGTLASETALAVYNIGRTGRPLAASPARLAKILTRHLGKLGITAGDERDNGGLLRTALQVPELFAEVFTVKRDQDRVKAEKAPLKRPVTVADAVALITSINGQFCLAVFVGENEWVEGYLFPGDTRPEPVAASAAPDAAPVDPFDALDLSF